jgi:CubicO group peptidase (beta-lactamase class C family)
VGLLPRQLALADEAAGRLLARGAGSALTLAVSRRGVLAHERHFGTASYGGSEPVTERSLFAIASVSKPIAATATMLLIERGLFGLETPVAALVPAFGQPAKRAVTVEHLLTHTSGLNEQFVLGVPYTTRDALYARLYQAPLAWPPGTHVSYSSAGFTLLGEIIRHVAGRPPGDFLADELFAPLGMADSLIPVPPEERGRIVECRRPNGEAMVPELLETAGLAGGVFSTAPDLARFGNLFLAGGRAADGTRILSPATVAAMLVDRTSHLPEAPGTPATPLGHPRRLGFGWMLASPALRACDLVPPRAFGHQGSTGAYLVVDPMHELVVARIGNRWGGDPAGMAEVLNAAVAAVVA